LARRLARKKVEVVNYPDGRFAVRFNGTALPFRAFDKIQTVEPGAVVESKRLGAVLALVKEQQDAFEPHRRRFDPERRRPVNNLEAPGLPTKRRSSSPVAPATTGADGPDSGGSLPLQSRHMTEHPRAEKPQTRR
jgi:hypothetical protein